MSLENKPYRVLARKYRPQTLSQLVGQEVLVKTLTQAMEAGRLPHAFVLHGIRGVGKTTTARIIAKALNCQGADGKGQITPNPCGVCSSCVSIMEDRHLDVVEMDAASRTGVDDIREVIEAAKYKAVNGRYKIYIIDEVHMLTKSAFNALLKTLEEPPPHVKFIFATTELRKIPDTVLSRCMRFDLARITPEILFPYFKEICGKESVSVEDEALALIVRAADGSARDGLSLLDQAISLSQGNVTTVVVRDMLGLIDRGRTFQLFTLLMEGKIAETLTEVRDIYSRGGEPTMVLQDMLDLIYWITCLKVSPAVKSDITWPESDRKQGVELAQRLSTPTLMRAWQVLSKGYEEVLRSPLPNQAVEMVLVRLAYLSEMPSAEDLLKAGQGGMGSGGGAMPSRAASSVSPTAVVGGSVTAVPQSPAPAPTTEAAVVPNPESFTDLLKVVAQAREPMVYSSLMQDAHLVHFEVGMVKLRVNDRAPKTFIKELEIILQRQTGQNWTVELSHEEGQATVADQAKRKGLEEEQQALDHPMVREMLASYPGVKAQVVREQQSIH